MNQHCITLVYFGFYDKQLLDNIAIQVKKVYNLPVKIKDGHIDLGEFYDSTRRQYNGSSLLKVVDQMINMDCLKIIGLFNVDLFIPILTFIFGQAYLNGKSGIASMYRLSNEKYALKKDDKLLTDRFIKVIIHELGHTFGLVHCYNPVCVMRPGVYIEDIDQKDFFLCQSCASILNEQE